MEAEAAMQTGRNDAKACADCHTTKTSLWRGGPDGPKSLCNACGIRYRKRRRQALGLPADPKKKAAADPHQPQLLQPRRKAKDQLLSLQGKTKAASSSSKKDKIEQDKEKRKKAKDKIAKEENSSKKIKKDPQQVTVELRVIGFGKEVMLKQQRMSEEERAAVLLMALSSGVIYA